MARLATMMAALETQLGKALTVIIPVMLAGTIGHLSLDSDVVYFSVPY